MGSTDRAARRWRRAGSHMGGTSRFAPRRFGSGSHVGSSPTGVPARGARGTAAGCSGALVGGAIRACMGSGPAGSGASSSGASSSSIDRLGSADPGGVGSTADGRARLGRPGLIETGGAGMERTGGGAGVGHSEDRRAGSTSRSFLVRPRRSAGRARAVRAARARMGRRTGGPLVVRAGPRAARARGTSVRRIHRRRACGRGAGLGPATGCTGRGSRACA